jgi:hypothetical protein
VKSLKEAVEVIQGIRGNSEYVLVEHLNQHIDDLEKAISIPTPGIRGLGLWRYRTETGTPPATGQLRFNNANISSATSFFLHETNDEGSDVSAFLTLLITVGSVLYVQDNTNADNHVLIEISTDTDSGAYRTYGIATIIEFGTEPSQNSKVILVA